MCKSHFLFLIKFFATRKGRERQEKLSFASFVVIQMNIRDGGINRRKQRFLDTNGYVYSRRQACDTVFLMHIPDALKKNSLIVFGFKKCD